MTRKLIRTILSLNHNLQTSNAMGAPRVVSISYPTLVSSPLSLGDSIEQAFGSHPQALGIIIVKDLPVVYQSYRESLLKYAYKFAHLPEETKERYTDPGSSYRYVMAAHKQSLELIFPKASDGHMVR
ncbi:hypothetical protein J3R82DRAFT_1066 [Butyriboletus roseoflavus]|nr:hypothetical protein J3R82DRAFT_1066 [Butyriboletus roseoflavus]